MVMVNILSVICLFLGIVNLDRWSRRRGSASASGTAALSPSSARLPSPPSSPFLLGSDRKASSADLSLDLATPIKLASAMIPCGFFLNSARNTKRCDSKISRAPLDMRLPFAHCVEVAFSRRLHIAPPPPPIIDRMRGRASVVAGGGLRER